MDGHAACIGKHLHVQVSFSSGTTPVSRFSRVQSVKATTNTSTTTHIAWTEDYTAILIPATLPSIGYVAKSIGVKTTCESITAQCADCSSYDSDVALKCQGAESGPVLNCRGPGLFNFTQNAQGYPNTPVQGLLSASNGSVITWEVENKYVGNDPDGLLFKKHWNQLRYA